MQKTSAFAAQLYQTYNQFYQEKIAHRRIKQADIQKLITSRADSEIWRIKTEGQSVEGRKIYSISTGEGKIQVLIWSQMHGNESTATRALFDMFNFFESDKFKSEKAQILTTCTLTFIPMLNPDGAEYFKRRNALDIDINRDALALSTPEAKILNRLREKTDADFAFNLHDQDPYYAAGDTQYPAAMSFLSPAFNSKKSLNSSRREAMQVIGLLNNILQNYIPDQIGKYSDAFMPSAFGDNIQQAGTSTVLIESGNTHNDFEKEYIRKLNFVGILSALLAISDNSYSDIDIAVYRGIPFNRKDKFFDMIFKNVTLQHCDIQANTNIGIRREFLKDTDRYIISDIGDLRHKTAYKIIDFEGQIIPHPVRIGDEANNLLTELNL